MASSEKRNGRRGRDSVPTVFFITHPDVVIDPGVPVPNWPLNERGQARMRAMTAQPWARGVRRIFARSERKARDAAQILAEGLGLGVYSVIANLAENDRSATGFLAKDEFEATVDAFFAQPLQSIRGCPRSGRSGSYGHRRGISGRAAGCCCRRYQISNPCKVKCSAMPPTPCFGYSPKH